MRFCLSPLFFKTMAPRAFCELCAGLGVGPSVLLHDDHWLTGASLKKELPKYLDLVRENGLEPGLVSVPNHVESLVQDTTVLEVLRDNGIHIVRLGQQKRIGFDARMLGLMVRRHAIHAAKLAQQFGLTFLFHIRQGMYPHNATAAYHMVEDMNPAQVQVMIDPGESPFGGSEDIFYQCDLLNEFVGAVGLRDTAVARTGEKSNDQKGWVRKAAPGHDGLTNWVETANALKSIGFGGLYEIEPCYDTDNLKVLVQKLKMEIQYFRQVFGAQD
ncbi:MAG: hypothetical protein GF331_26060 [Chitinivibrionales bacterium]|nr:hypothetical protein [Chitinivibrionales bacterium]